MAQTGKLGMADSRLGNLLLAFAGAEDPLPSTGILSGRLGTSDSFLADLLLGLEGPEGAKLYNLYAESTLALTQSAVCAATIVGHPSPSWVLGGIDSELGDTQPAFTGADEPLPAYGARTGKLGVGLGSLVLALEGVLGAQIINVTAQSTIALAQSAGCDPEIVGHPSPPYTLGSLTSALGGLQEAYAGPADPRPMTGSITGRLGTADSLLGGMRCALGEEEGDSSAKTWNVAALSALALSSEAAVANFARSVLASNAIGLSVVAATAISHSVDADNLIAFNDAAETAFAKSVSAESGLTFDVTASSRYARYWPTAESTLSFDHLAEATTKYVVEVVGDSLLELTSEASGRYARFRPVAESVISLIASADGRHSHFRPSADSQVEFTTTASSRYARFWPSAETLISFSQTAGGHLPLIADVEAISTIVLSTEASGRHSHFRPTASSLFTVSDAAVAAGCFSRHAGSVLQTVTEDYDPALDEFVTTIIGLQDSADVCRVVSRSAGTVIPLLHRAGAVRIASTAIDVSATNVLELTDRLWKNEVGDAISSIALSQAAVAQRCKPIGSVVELMDSAGVSVVRKRSASSVLELRQSVSFSIVRGDLAYKYHPFIGEGDPGSPTPPPAALAGPLAGVTVPFQLLYPATGTVTDSVTLRAPDFGNKDRLSFNRVLRETRGGTLVVYADPIWPKIQTLVVSFSGLSVTEKDALLAFMDEHLGMEIGLLDWEHRYWRGVIVRPDDPAVQDDRDTFTASFEFEGELAPEWTP